jgi:hypothetical protein
VRATCLADASGYQRFGNSAAESDALSIALVAVTAAQIQNASAEGLEFRL